MFGLDLVSIIAAAIGGGVGGALGGLLSVVFNRPGVRAGLVAGLAVAGAAIGSPLIKPFLETSVGTSVRGAQFDATYEAEFLPAIARIPAFARVLREHPEVGAKLRAKAREAYEKGGAAGLVEDASAIGALVLGDAFISYMPRARGEDLILFAKTMGEIFGAMNAKDPEACILYQFGTNYGRPLSTSRLLAAIGTDGQQKQVDVMNAIVVNAADAPIAFDTAKAELAIAALGTRHAPLLTGKSAEVAQGARPPTDAAEAKAACSFGEAMFNDLATMDKATAELALRKMFAS
jgi:hypothetical protein